MDKQTILIVDDESNNIKLLSQILRDKYRIRIALSGEEAFKRVLIEPAAEIILLDIMMPGMNGYEVCRKLKADPRSASIPVIFVSAKSEIEDETYGFEVGAVDYISKPVSIPIVQARISTHLTLANQKLACETLVQKRTEELLITQKASISMLGEAGHYNDTDTGVHIWRMAAYTRILAQAAGWSVEDADRLELAAPMHDTGKIGIPDSILKAPRKLTPEEWKIMKSHSGIGYSILSKSKTALFELAAEVALYHHERWDGSGYPKGLLKESIPPSAQIVAIADVFDALTTNRAYKKAWPIEDAFREIDNNSGSHFNPDLVKEFLELESLIISAKNKWDDHEKDSGLSNS